MEARAHCAVCRGDIPAGARFCPTCGASVGNTQGRMATGLLPARHLLRSRYVIDRKLAQGGQSAVYLALDTYQNSEKRAIKEMSESQLEPNKRQQAVNDFMREAQMLAALSHKALAHVFEFFTEGDRYFLVMEYVPGHNLEDEMVQYRREPLGWEDVTEWGMALADVLAYLHSQRPPIIYRDLKPANVMLLPDGSVKLIDFGIARWLHPARVMDTMQLGTDGYAPLEQYTSRSEPRSDLYALGASLYHLLTGKVPEAAPMRAAGHNFKTIRTINPRVPEPVERVIQQALSLQANDRFPNAQSMREALEWARRQSMPGGSVPGFTSHPPSSYPSGPPSLQSMPPRHIVRATGAPDHAKTMPVTGAAPHPRVTNRPMTGTHSGNTDPTADHIQRTPHRKTDSMVSGPRLVVWPLRLDASYLLVNQVVTHELEIGNRGSGSLVGVAETNIAAMTVEPTHIDDSVSHITVRIDATGLATGPYVCHVALRTNGGVQIVQVRFVVHPAGDMFVGRSRPTGA